MSPSQKEKIKNLSNKIGLFAGPSAFLLMYLAPTPEALSTEAWRVAAVGLFMAIWWVTEAVPIPATALLPIVLFPILEVSTIGQATAPFANPLIYLFMGGFIIALALEKTNLHRRIALRIVLFVGVKPTSVIIGFMLAAAFLSMWVSNTATAMMMLPIALSIIRLVERGKDISRGELQTNFGMVMLLCLAYACNVGGIGTLIGTPPNALMAGYMLDTYGVEIGFAQWMMLGLPIVIVSLPIIFVILTRLVYPIKITEIPGGKAMIRDELKDAGRMSRAEKMVSIVFLTVASLWIFRPLLEPFIPNLSDTGIAIFGAVLMFLLPVSFRNFEFVLQWEDAKRLPWEVLILFGGGLSLAAAITDTGLAEWIGMSISHLDWIPIFALLLLSLLVIIFLTEITSNTATAAAFLPILASVAIMMGYDPMVLAIPAAIGASCAFMLPVATPPNAIVYGSGLVSIPQMARAGFMINLSMVVVISVAVYLLLYFVFGIAF
ncbi:solute carrier family 13 (sodium-dependent dicarboxylate transporter), member 2/3/5 [Cyclonatronum proteinivorum]|uniref:Solute carrier family 13 (Sodium-dependent dicarboxylate transporter), member 2/3/5 n=1 Tax=Cyclonatronum proteinivorum TaxID=1457365 RepID=A0A345UPE9_9BACT|nr:DASS family sodium-coupled anion symporter [Cyclonatronum proteinivorum]AXJ02351.1 solute carrier family 13 (sodium-dependent dicarboxylate transporter), member 2/3/5 [Cyclonatronum proteinivorum]